MIMKKTNQTLVYIALFILAVLTVMSSYMLLFAPKTLDFRGTVTAIESNEDGTVLHITIADASYQILANDKTKIAYCCKDDPDIQLSDIKIGDTIEGNYRTLSQKEIAKFITVQYQN